MRYKYCPQCGSKLIEKAAGDDGLVPYCEACSKYWFDSFASCVIIMIVNEYDEIVLLKQSYMSSEHWNFISGYMTPGENAEEAALREVKEEVGIDLESLEPSGTWWFAEGDMLMHGFIGHAAKQPLTLSAEVDRAEWVPIDKAPELMYPDSPGNAQYGTYKVYLTK
ncbi:MAG: NUDIX domain-containing protein [Bacillota bacterium]|nr:NUDIX domain-containing protein [Bacillota bacterium]